ncbi:hypothetical protein [Alcanivorax quisquiliarum]|uniref:Uncharacterized protein n=1 Tax=Alcanivorax quisquiliarum TaxID=2933565 RepID=A0ABT0E9E5_9GAMM|nr:hypothetical protein [Alcanivorax quisquiliarum]MCK0538471.1 hypothetical protein [Alcanivorax quisquiliarum]
MIYFGTKKNLEDVERFGGLVLEFWEKEEQMREFRHANPDPEVAEKYQELREELAKKTPKIIRIAKSTGVPCTVHSYPAPAVGGPVIPVNLFQAILHDDSHGGIDRQRIYDTINTLRGQLEEKIRLEFWRIINPAYWLGRILEMVLRIPFWLLSKTGFDVTKIEDHFLGKFFKVLEVVAIFYLAIWLGVSEDAFTSLFSRGS